MSLETTPGTPSSLLYQLKKFDLEGLSSKNLHGRTALTAQP
jgi:hypothetical protein